MPPANPVTVERILKLLAKVFAKFIRRIDAIAVRVSLAVVIVAIIVDAGIVVGLVYLLPQPSSTVSKSVRKLGLKRLPEAVDLGVYCGEPASGNLTKGQCQWEITDFDKVCEFQYSASPLPRPIHMSFSDSSNLSSGQCYASNGQVAGGVQMSDYCNVVLPKRPAGSTYEAAPVANTKRWICERKLDIVAVCVSTFQLSNLEARIDKGKVVCYAHR